MHLVQLPLEVFELLLDGVLTVELLIVLLPLVGRLLAELYHLEILVDELFQLLRALGSAVLSKDGVALLVGGVDPWRHSRCDLAEGLPLIDPDAGRLSPLQILTELSHGNLDGLHLLLCFGSIEVIDLITAGHFKVDMVSRRHAHTSEIHAVFALHDQIARLIDLCDGRGEANRVEAVALELVTGERLF